MLKLQALTLQAIETLYPDEIIKIDEFIATGKFYADDPELPARSPQKKAEDYLFGKVGEILTKHFTRLIQHNDMFHDLTGCRIVDDIKLEGTIEVKVLKEPSIEQARLAFDRHIRNTCYPTKPADFFIFWYCDRVKEIFYPYMVANRGFGSVLEPIKYYSI